MAQTMVVRIVAVSSSVGVGVGVGVRCVVSWAVVREEDAERVVTSECVELEILAS